MLHHAGGKNRALDGKQRPLGVRATAYIDHCWYWPIVLRGRESGLRWQAEAVRGKGNRLYQPLLVMVHRVWGEESGFRWQAEAIRGKGDRLYQPLLVLVHRARGESRASDGKQRLLRVRATAYINRCW